MLVVYFATKRSVFGSVNAERQTLLFKMKTKQWENELNSQIVTYSVSISNYLISLNVQQRAKFLFTVNTSFSFSFFLFLKKNAPVSKHKDMRTRLGSGTISYKSLSFAHPSLQLVPFFTGMRERSIC